MDSSIWISTFHTAESAFRHGIERRQPSVVQVALVSHVLAADTDDVFIRNVLDHLRKLTKA